jgi:hypothetical protein
MNVINASTFIGVRVLSDKCPNCGHKLMCPQCSDDFSITCDKCNREVKKPALHNWTCPFCFANLLTSATSPTPKVVDWGCAEESDLSQ